MAEVKSQEAAGILKTDPESGKLVITDEARRVFVKRTKQALMGGIDLPFPCVGSIPVLDIAKDIDLDDREKYPDFHKFWIDGMFQSIARALNVAGNFAIPVFDPTALAPKLGLNIPDVTLPAIAASFAAPIPMAFDLMNVKPPDLPNLIPTTLDLIIPSIPTIPNLDIELPDINFAPFGTFDIVLALNLALPNLFKDLLLELATPKFWLSFTLPGLFELSCKTFTKGVTGVWESAPVKSPPITAIAAASALGTCTSDCASNAGTSSVIGSGVVVKKQGEQQGYLPKAAKTAPDLISEGIMNGLKPFIPDPATDGVTWVFKDSPRNTFFGDPLVVDYLYALGAHMSSIKDTFEVKDYLVEVGNLCGKDEVSGWRWSKWSEGRSKLSNKKLSGHYGCAFDLAYPLKRDSSRISGMNTNSKVIVGDVEGGKGESPYLPGPNTPLPVDQYDFEVMYEILRWTKEFVTQLITDKRIGPPQLGNNKVNFQDVWVSVSIGQTTYDRFISWCNKNSKSTAGIPFDPRGGHDDHLHFRWRRTQVDPNGSQADKDAGGNGSKPYYIIPWQSEVKYPDYDRGVVYSKITNPEDGSQVNVVV